MDFNQQLLQILKYNVFSEKYIDWQPNSNGCAGPSNLTIKGVDRTLFTTSTNMWKSKKLIENEIIGNRRLPATWLQREQSGLEIEQSLSLKVHDALFSQSVMTAQSSTLLSSQNVSFKQKMSVGVWICRIYLADLAK